MKETMTTEEYNEASKEGRVFRFDVKGTSCSYEYGKMLIAGEKEMDSYRLYEFTTKYSPSGVEHTFNLKRELSSEEAQKKIEEAKKTGQDKFKETQIFGGARRAAAEKAILALKNNTH